MTNRVTCTNCGEPLADDLVQQQPCPKCGSMARTVNVEARMMAMSSATASVTVIPYSETLLAKSQELIDKGDFNIAVVVAHMACEIAVERVMSEAFMKRDIEDLEDPVLDFLSGYSLANERLCKLFNALTRKQVQTQPFWPAFKESATRRNNVMHHGALVTKAEAQTSHRAASDLVAYLA